MKRLALSSVLLLITHFIFAQHFEKWIGDYEKIPSQKIFVHAQNQHILLGENLGFKIYLVDGRSGKLLPGAENIYVYLYDPLGSVAHQSVLIALKGQAVGQIPSAIFNESGKYTMQVFTNYLRNFGEDSFFYQPVYVHNNQRELELAAEENSFVTLPQQMEFFPEGGKLLANMQNLVAFKVCNENGHGTKATGKLFDENGKTIVDFETSYEGSGLFFFQPEEGKKYVAKIDGNTKIRQILEPQIAGIKIQVVNQSTQEVTVNVATNTSDFGGRNFTLANLADGEVQFYQQFELKGKNHLFRFKNDDFKAGVNQLVLLNDSFEILSKRLLFSQKPDSERLIVESKDLGNIAGQPLEFKIVAQDITDSMNLSAVLGFNENLQLPPNLPKNNLKSYFFVDSEFRAFDGNSARLFEDGGLQPATKLELTMLTNTEKYLWDWAPSLTNGSQKFEQKVGITLRGMVKNKLNGSAVEDGEVSVVIQKNGEMAFLQQQTDSRGYFDFTGLFFADSASIHLQAKTASGAMNTEPVLFSVFPEVGLPKQFGPLSIDREKENSLPLPIEPAMAVEDGEYGKWNRPDDGFSRLYPSADYVLEVNENESSFNNILDFIAGKISGVDVNGDEVMIRGAGSFGKNSTPLFLVDGVPLVANTSFGLSPLNENFSVQENEVMDEQVVRSVKAIPLNDVEKIEILKSPVNTAVFGIQGANGVIAIYMRHGEQYGNNGSSKGILIAKIPGFSNYKAAISKHVSLGNDVSSGKKQLLHPVENWLPNVLFENGHAALQVDTSGQTGHYIVFLEGVSGGGEWYSRTVRYGLVK